jgi:hypothetical protein
MIWLILLAVLFSSLSYAGLTDSEVEKREKIRYAMNNRIISLYEIPFETYVKLEMWEELGFIFDANNKNMIKYRLPGMYYSRPHIVKGYIWVFGNDVGGGIHIFHPNTLKFIRKIDNPDYEKYAGGVRKIFGNTVISGGSDKDVDSAVIWNTDTDDIRTIKLEAGHYVGAIEVENNRLYIGSCGEDVNAWTYNTLEFVGTYSTDGDSYTSWNQKECISGLKIIDSDLVGAGEKKIFIWDIESKKLRKTYPKALSNSIVFFYEDKLIEYKGDRFVVRYAADGKIIKEAKAEKSIEDLIVTAEKLLATHNGELLILALRHNMGILFYDFNTLKLINKIHTNGETLTAYRDSIFATDDRHVYRYDIANKDKEKYEAFLKTIHLDTITLNDNTYYQLLRCLRDYPEIIAQSGITNKFLETHKLELTHSFKYGKLGERFVSDDRAPNKKASDENDGYKQDVYGYKLLYEIKNASDNYYFLTLAAAWSGEYGKDEADEDSWQVLNSEKRGFAKQSFFILPQKGKYKDAFDIGEREPLNFLLYPTRIEKVSKGYYDGLMKALGHSNEDVSLIDKYLGDKLIKDWHDTLKQRKAELLKEKKDDSWFF